MSSHHSGWGLRTYNQDDDDNDAYSDIDSYYSRGSSYDLQAAPRALKEEDFDRIANVAFSVGSPGSASVHSNYASSPSKKPITPVTIDHFSDLGDVELASERPSESVAGSMY